ncbi:molybdenum ABC transporter permease subunit [Helicobacter enhydrae]|uniref:Molybdenum transport system permease n=1 Tax=Helicobacter enhydrae TaxID=222136 RepID=A0A1B1U4H8_9HELI|nr:molybdate ABC transporter permease subunit [Helicobacter enhydrae]ANV97641.1 molybdenum ABC transporter permease subunit [Helicobacter enhydrae]
MFVQTMQLTFSLAFCTMVILFPIGICLGYYLSCSRGALKMLVEVLVWLPLMLPPTVLGFYLLLLFSPNLSPLGQFLDTYLDLRLVFSFEGILLGSVIFGLPFMVNPIKSGLQSLPIHLSEASYILGRGKFYTLIKVLLPNIKPSLLIALIGTFVHSVGEFGVVAVIGGNQAGSTRVASIAIYEMVIDAQYELAHQYALTLLVVCGSLLLLILYVNQKYLGAK